MCLCCYCVVFLYNHKTRDLFGFIPKHKKHRSTFRPLFFIFCFTDILDLFLMSEDEKQTKIK